jgi:hypothetical protein
MQVNYSLIYKEINDFKLACGFIEKMKFHRRTQKNQLSVAVKQGCSFNLPRTERAKRPTL